MDIYEEIKKELAQTKSGLKFYESFGEIYIEVIAILWKHDPMKLPSPHKDEYEPEARTIVPRLKEATSEVELSKIVNQEFVRWFGSTVRLHLELESKCREIAHDIWAVYQSYNC